MSQTAKGLLLSLQTQTKKSAVELQVATGYNIPFHNQKMSQK